MRWSQPQYAVLRQQNRCRPIVRAVWLAVVDKTWTKERVRNCERAPKKCIEMLLGFWSVLVIRNMLELDHSFTFDCCMHARFFGACNFFSNVLEISSMLLRVSDFCCYQFCLTMFSLVQWEASLQFKGTNLVKQFSSRRNTEHQSTFICLSTYHLWSIPVKKWKWASNCGCFRTASTA